MKLVVCTAIWNRPALTKMVLEYYDREGLDIVVAYSKAADEYPVGCLGVMASNAMLGSKWNTTLAGAQLLAADAVMIVGSDDLVSADYIKHATRLLEKGCDLIQPAGCHFVQIPEGYWFYHPIHTGAGRIISGRLLDKLDWRLWPDEAMVKLDGAAKDRLNTVAHKAVISDVGAVVDLKTNENMWTFAQVWHMCGTPEIQHGDKILKTFGRTVDGIAGCLNR